MQKDDSNVAQPDERSDNERQSVAVRMAFVVNVDPSVFENHRKQAKKCLPLILFASTDDATSPGTKKLFERRWTITDYGSRHEIVAPVPHVSSLYKTPAEPSPVAPGEFVTKLTPLFDVNSDWDELKGNGDFEVFWEIIQFVKDKAAHLDGEFPFPQGTEPTFHRAAFEAFENYSFVTCVRFNLTLIELEKVLVTRQAQCVPPYQGISETCNEHILTNRDVTQRLMEGLTNIDAIPNSSVYPTYVPLWDMEDAVCIVFYLCLDHYVGLQLDNQPSPPSLLDISLINAIEAGKMNVSTEEREEKEKEDPALPQDLKDVVSGLKRCPSCGSVDPTGRFVVRVGPPAGCSLSENCPRRRVYEFAYCPCWFSFLARTKDE